MKPYPVMLNLTGRRAVVVGGGPVAARKVRDLLECDARVTVIAPDIHPEIESMRETGADALEILRRPYRKGDLDGAAVAFAATGDSTVNGDVYRDASETGLPVNAVDDPDHCSFFVPSWFSRQGLVVAVSTGGVSPALAARVRREIESLLPDSVENELSALAEARRLLMEDDEFKEFDSRDRGAILKQIVRNDDLLANLVESRRRATLKEFVRSIAERYMK